MVPLNSLSVAYSYTKFISEFSLGTAAFNVTYAKIGTKSSAPLQQVQTIFKTITSLWIVHDSFSSVLLPEGRYATNCGFKRQQNAAKLVTAVVR